MTRALWALAWPILISNQLLVLTTVVTLYWIGHAIGPTGLAVESLFRPFELLFGCLFTSTAVGASVLVSRSVGAEDRQGMKIAGNAATLTIVASLVFAAVAIPLAPVIASLLAPDAITAGPMLRFLIAWVAIALPTVTIVELLLEVANATGDTRFNIVRVLVELAFTAALTPCLIYVGFGMAGPPLAQGITFALLGLFLWFSLRRRREQLGEGRFWRFDWAVWRELLAVGVPVEVSRVVMFAVELVLVRFVATDGDANVAGYGVASAIILFGAMTTMAIAQATSILVGQSLGADQPERARRAVRTALTWGAVIVCLFVAATTIDRPVVRLFTSSPAVADAAHEALKIMRWGVLGGGAWQILLMSLAAYRRTVRAGILMIFGEGVGLCVAFGYPGSYLRSVSVAFVVSNVAKALLLLWLFYRNGLRSTKSP